MKVAKASLFGGHKSSSSSAPKKQTQPQTTAESSTGSSTHSSRGSETGEEPSALRTPASTASSARGSPLGGHGSSHHSSSSSNSHGPHKKRSSKELPQLFWYMELNQWTKATERLRRHPREAKTWATLKTKSLLVPAANARAEEKVVTSTKRLALHHACFKLRSAAGGKPGSKEEDAFVQICQFILALLRLYPEAAGQRESRHGCLPLHLAAFASCAPKEGAEDEDSVSAASPSSGGGLSRPPAMGRRAHSDATCATVETHLSQIHAEESYTGRIMGNSNLRRQVGQAADPNIRVAAKHKIVISAVREELAVAVVNALLDAYPKAVRVDSEGGRLPLHTACAGRATPRVVQTLVRADPAAARHRNKDGFLPLHLAAHWGVSHPNVAVTLLQSYPDATVGRNRWERTPLEEALCMAGENGRGHQAALVRALRKHPSYWTRPTADYLGSPRKSCRKSSKSSAHEPIDMDESLPSNDDTMDTPEESTEGFELQLSGSGILGKLSPLLGGTGKRKTLSALTQNLSTLIQQSQWDAVLERLEAHPLEAEEELQVMTRGGFLASAGFFPLHYACERQPPVEVVQALIAAQPMAVLTRALPGGGLPLHIAATWYAQDDVIQALLSADAGGCQVTDELGNVPLHSACFSGAPVSVLEILLRTDPEAVLLRNTQGSRPADICKRLAHSHRRGVLALLTLKKEELLAKHRRKGSSGNWGDLAAQACASLDLTYELNDPVGDPTDLQWI